MPQSEPLDSPPMSPLAPSVEKAYYRKCIQLKRRLNEVQAANDETKLRRLRLDRAIMKMRLERAFILDELRKRMDEDVDGSDGSGDEGMATPPPDRPHRDKRRRPQPSQPSTTALPPTNSFQSSANTPSAQRTATDADASTPIAPGSGAQVVPANSTKYEGNDAQPPRRSPESVFEFPPTAMYGTAPSGMDVDPPSTREEKPVSREAGATGEPNGAESTMVEENGGRRVLPEESHGGSHDTERGSLTSGNN